MKKMDISSDNAATKVKYGTDARDAVVIERETSVFELEALRQHVRELEAETATMREIVLRVAEARMARDPVTQIESCLHCALKRGGTYGYTGMHADTCIVTRARALGF